MNHAATATLSPTDVRRYKACRVCRRQKLRCDGASPCARCRTSGAACIYDPTARRRRPPPSATPAPSSQAQKISALSQEVQQLRALVGRPQASTSLPVRSPPAPTDTVQSASTDRTPSRPRDPEVLSPDDLEVPVTAVHITLRPQPTGRAQRNAEGWTPWNQSKWHQEEYRIRSILDQGLVDQTLARHLFGSFMQHCNIATPIFDPVLDTFESINELYPFTLAVVLYLAARQDSLDGSDRSLAAKLEIEVKRLAANTLFDNPCSLDSVEAMLLLAVYSEKTWFALGHAHQMAQDLRLQDTIDKKLPSSEELTRNDMHCARLWLYVVFFERAMAIASGRWPRCDPIDHAALNRYVRLKFSHPSDIFFCGGLELFDMSGALRISSELPAVEKLGADLDAWYARWNAHYDEQCVHSSSLQRMHLAVYMLLARTWQMAIVLSRRLRSHSPDAQIGLLIDQIIASVHELYEYISGSEAYRTYLPWAPTCEILLLTFAIILGCRVFVMKPDVVKYNKFKEASGPLAHILQKHPCQALSRALGELLESSTPPNMSDDQAPTNADDFGFFDAEDWNFDVHFGGLFSDLMETSDIHWNGQLSASNVDGYQS